MISTLLLTASLAVHPLGNFSVNELVELTVRPDRIDAVAVVDLAELPALQMTPSCEDFASALTLRVNGNTVRWHVQSRQLEQPDGAAGLKTTRLTCSLTAPADLNDPSTLNVDNGYLPDRVGWHEITATGDGVTLETNLPSRSNTDRLRNYPTDPLSTPMQVRKASFTAKPGADAQRSAAAIVEDRSLLKRAESWLTGAIGDPTPVIGLLAVFLAIVLGAAHAALPGHGKTVIAVYMAGRKGRRRDAVIVGATVTLTHTAGVLILGIGLTAVASLAAESVLAWLGIVSGSVVFTVGVAMLIGSLRQHRSRALATAHAEAPATRWREVARWHDRDHGVGIVRSDRTHDDRTHDDGTHDDTTHVDDASVHDGRINHGHVDHAPHAHESEGEHAHEGGEHVHDSGHDHGQHHGHDHGYGHHHQGHHHHHHGHGHEHGHGHGFWRGHRHSHGHDSHGHDSHGHGHAHEPGQGRASLTALGIAGGLVPSPTALVVLLGAVALGRTWFGILLIFAYGLGMAGTLTAAGLMLLRLRDRWSWLNRLSIPPTATGSLIIAVGLGLAARAALTI